MHGAVRSLSTWALYSLLADGEAEERYDGAIGRFLVQHG